MLDILLDPDALIFHSVRAIGFGDALFAVMSSSMKSIISPGRWNLH